MLIKFTKSYNLLKATAFMLAAVNNMYVGPAIHDASAKFCLQHNLLVYENRSLAAEANSVFSCKSHVRDHLVAVAGEADRRCDGQKPEARVC